MAIPPAMLAAFAARAGKTPAPVSGKPRMIANTPQAIRKFQAANGLKPTGVVDGATKAKMRALNVRFAGKAAPAKGAMPPGNMPASFVGRGGVR